MEATIKKVSHVTNIIDAQISEKGISITHWLPSRMARVKPIIVQFARRVKKFFFFQRKKEFGSLDVFQKRKIFEDFSSAPANFLRIMKADAGIQSAWKREGSFFYIWKKDERL